LNYKRPFFPDAKFGGKASIAHRKIHEEKTGNGGEIPRVCLKGRKEGEEGGEEGVHGSPFTPTFVALSFFCGRHVFSHHGLNT
jgi:hypothetical protein